MTTIPAHKEVTSTARRGRWAVVLLTLAAAGCPMTTQPPGPTTDGNEPNNAFNAASKVVFNTDRRATLKGTVSASHTIGGLDLDVFDVGPLGVGDRVAIDVSTGTSTLDAAFALFDAHGRLALTNDDRNGSGARALDPYGDFVVRHAGEPYYLVVSRSAFARQGERTGDYQADVRITAGAAVPAPAGQILYVNWEGGPITAPGLGRTRIAPFDAGLIDPIYDGETERLKGLIVDSMIENYARFNVTIHTSDASPPSGVKYSTVNIGCYDSAAYGISQSVDAYDVDRCDDAIIFAESFFPQQFSHIPALDELGVAIGNVASHEAGHLMGLNHVSDELDLMDAVSPPDALFLDENFKESVLHTDIMPIGTQDAVLLLTEIVGLKGS